MWLICCQKIDKIESSSAYDLNDNLADFIWVQTKELKSRVNSVDNQLEQTSLERDEARDLVTWQRRLIERQLQQVL